MQKNLNIEKIIFKVVQMKFLAMHINNQQLSFDIFMVGNLLNIFMEHDLNILMSFGIKEKCICGEWGGAESRGNGARPVE